MELANADKFIVAGDIHGNFWHLKRVMDYAKQKLIDVILIVGDFGYFKEYAKFLKDTNNYAKENGITIYFLDGNHEDHPALNQLPLNNDGYHKIDDNIYHLPRAFTWDWFGLTCMTLGGAYGVDRNNGIEGKDWFPEEVINQNDYLRAINVGKVDLLFTHDAPNRVMIPALNRKITLNNVRFPKNHLDNAKKHRELLGEIVDLVEPEYLFHGHYHCDYTYDRINANGTITHIRGLNKDDKPLDKNIVILDYLDYI